MIDKRLKELRIREKEIADLIKKMREEQEVGVGKGKKPKEKDKPRGPMSPAFAMAEAVPTGLTFSGFKDAWSNLASSLKPDDSIAKEQLTHLRNIDENVEEQTKNNDSGGMTE